MEEESDMDRAERYAYYKRHLGFDEEALEECRLLDVKRDQARKLIDPAIGACRNCGLALHLAPEQDGCRRMINCDVRRAHE